MSEFVNAVLLLLIGSILGWFVGRLQGRASNRRKFRDAVRVILDQMSKAEGNDLTQIYKDSIPTLSVEVARVMEDIHWWHRERFRLVWDEYHAEQDAPLNMRTVETKDRFTMVAYLMPHYEEGRKRLESQMQELMKCAK